MRAKKNEEEDSMEVEDICKEVVEYGNDMSALVGVIDRCST